MTPIIPPRPWRVIPVPSNGCVWDADEKHIVCGTDADTADLIVRLINAEPDIIAALEAAETMLDPLAEIPPRVEDTALALIRQALSRLRP